MNLPIIRPQLPKLTPIYNIFIITQKRMTSFPITQNPQTPSKPPTPIDPNSILSATYKNQQNLYQQQQPILKTMFSFDDLSLEGYQTESAKIIGSGSYGRIYQTFSIKYQTDVAIKQICLKKIKDQKQEINSLQREIEVMKKLRSPHIVQFLQYFYKKNYAYIIMELCTNDLRKQLRRRSKFPQKQTIQIFQQIIKGVKVLTENSYIHRDLKPENVLIKNGVYKIGDFGLTKQVDFNGNQKLWDICGTPIYMAPQLLNNLPYSPKCDIWSLGLILYEMLYGSTPWPIKCIQSYRNALKKRPLAFPFDVRIGKQTKDFLKRALVVDQQKRMSWKQLYEHPLIESKVSGETVVQAQVDVKVRQILEKIQRQTKRKQIHIIEIVEKYEKLGDLNHKQFSNLLKQLNPTISTHEIKIIYDICKKNKNGKIQKNQYHQILCGTTYHENHSAEKQIDQIIGIICTKNVQVKDLFQQFDKHKIGSLSLDDFRNMIKYIAPAYQNQFIDILFGIMDADHNGTIEKQQFINCIGGGLPNQKHYIGLQNQKTLRNMKILKIHLLQLHLSAAQIVKLVDENKDQQLDIHQFTKLMEIINFHIQTDEILNIFKILDCDHSGKISLKKLQNYIH